MLPIKSAFSLLAVAVVTLTACEKEVILPGERFGTRTPLEDSIPSGENPAPKDSAALIVNQAVPIALPPAQSNAEWTHRGGNVRHAGPHGALSAAPARVWSANIGQASSRRNRISAAPVVAEGRAYTLDAEMGLHATALNGAPLWGVDLTPAGDRPSDVSGGGIAAAAGRVYVATGYGELIAVEAASGRVIWRQQLGAAVAGAPAVEGNTVYVVGRDSAAWAVDTTDGKVRWQITGAAGKPGMVGSSAPAITDRLAILPMPSGEIRAVLKSAGVEVWQADIAGSRLGRAYALVADVTGDPVVIGDTIYVGNAAGRTHAVSGAGETLWSATEGALGPVLPVGGSVFLVNDQAQLVRLDAATGAVIWRAEMPYFEKDKPKKQKAITAHYGPVLAGGRIAVASGDGLLRFFAPQTGALVGQAEIPGGAAAQPALAGGLLLVVGQNGQLHAFR